MQQRHDILLSTRGLKKHYRVGGLRGGSIYAVNGVDLDIRRGETLGLVGESGCGKSTLGSVILRLQQPTAGRLIYDGRDITNVNMKPYRRRMQVVFQDPAGSLDPRMRIVQSVCEAYEIHRIGASKTERIALSLAMLERVGLERELADRYPGELSGGQQQRVVIARALAAGPEFLVCDEPVSALDVSCQSQVINLLEDLQRELRLTYLFIAHDLSVVRHISNQIGVMYLGRIVELAPSDELVDSPLHPYTKSLLSAIPIPDPKASRARKPEPLPGEPPSALNPPSGCPFHTRCRYALAHCAHTPPEYREITPGHFCACHLYQ